MSDIPKITEIIERDKGANFVKALIFDKLCEDGSISSKIREACDNAAKEFRLSAMQTAEELVISIKSKRTDSMADENAVKVMSLEAQSEMVEAAFETQFLAPSPIETMMGMTTDDEEDDCCDVYPDYVIYCDDEGFCWQVNYTISAAGIVFTPREEWVKVEQQWKPMKAANPDNTLLMFGSSVKSLGDNRIGGYLIIWGDDQHKDLTGEYFTKSTDLSLDWMEKRPCLYHHGLDGSVKTETIGTIETIKTDDTGLWVEAQLNQRNKYVKGIKKLIDKGALGWSSGTLAHLREVKSTGEITRWPLIEGSLTPSPAEPQTNAISLKSLISSLSNESSEPEAQAPEVEQSAVSAAEPILTQTEIKTAYAESLSGSENGEDNMNGEAVVASVMDAIEGQLNIKLTDVQKSAVLANVKSAKPAETAVEFSEAAKAADFAKSIAGDVLVAVKSVVADDRSSELIKDAVKNAFANAQPVAQTGSYSAGARIDNVRDRRFDNLKAADLIFGASVLYANDGKLPGTQTRISDDTMETMLRAAATKAFKEGDAGHATYSDYGFKSAIGIKANEVMATNLSSNGQNWVGQAYESNIWLAAREAPMYQELVNRGIMQLEVPQGNNQITIPTEGSDPTWYSLVEQNSITTDERLPITPKSSTPTANKRTLTVGGIAARVMFTDFEQEDALFAILPFYRNRMEVTAQEQIEYTLFNGDTATGANTNINLIDGTPSTDSKSRGPAYLAIDGILKLPLVTTASLSRDGNVGGFDETDFLSTWKLLPSPQQIDNRSLLFVSDPQTYMAALNIAAFKTRDVFNPATLENGELKNVYGIDYRRSGQLALANSAGKIPAAGGTLGRLLLIRPQQWAIGWKRQVKIETARDVDAQATSVITTLRFGITYRSATGGAAVSYNLPV